MQDPDKFIEQAYQEQQELRRKLEDATERVKTIQVTLPALPSWNCYLGPSVKLAPCQFFTLRAAFGSAIPGFLLGSGRFPVEAVTACNISQPDNSDHFTGGCLEATAGSSKLCG